MKKPRTVKTKIEQLIKAHGGKKELAKELSISCSHIYKMLNGYIPSKRLYRDICQLAERA